MKYYALKDFKNKIWRIVATQDIISHIEEVIIVYDTYAPNIGRKYIPY